MKDDIPDGKELFVVRIDDEDIVSALQKIHGFIDVFTSDLRTIYTYAQKHALDRSLRAITAASVMRKGIKPLSPDENIDQAAKAISQSGLTGLPVVNRDGQVLGLLSTSDLLGNHSDQTFFSQVASDSANACQWMQRWETILVREAMNVTAPVLIESATHDEILAALQGSSVECLPVVSKDACYVGMVVRSEYSLLRMRGARYVAHP